MGFLGEKNYNLCFKFKKSYKTKQQSTRIKILVHNFKKHKMNGKNIIAKL